MMNKREEFLRELKSLLENYKAEMTADDHWDGYAECGQDIRITVDFDDYKIDSINIGQWMCGDQDIDKTLERKD